MNMRIVENKPFRSLFICLAITTFGGAMAADESVPPGATLVSETKPLDEGSGLQVTIHGYTVASVDGKGTVRIGLWASSVGDVKLQEMNYNSKGILHGQQRTFYPTGKLMMLETFLDGRRNGTSEWYSPEGVLIARSTFLNGSLDGESCEFDTKGKLTKRMMYKNGIAETGK